MTFELQKTITIGKYAVTPLSHQTRGGDYCSSVSIRRGVYDRVYSFERRFGSRDRADEYALSQASAMMGGNSLN